MFYNYGDVVLFCFYCLILSVVFVSCKIAVGLLFTFFFFKVVLIVDVYTMSCEGSGMENKAIRDGTELKSFQQDKMRKEGTPTVGNK
jgi:hypothetical protein